MQAAFAAGEISAEKLRQRIQSWIGHAAHAACGPGCYLRQHSSGGARSSARATVVSWPCCAWRLVEQQPRERALRHP
jgi:hypothetical protein